MLIAIDHGNSAIKTVHHNFVAGLSRHSVRPPMADEVLEYDGSYWTLSGQRQAYQRDKTRDESYFILSLFAIAKELSHAGALPASERIELAVGLPPEHYGILRDKFKQYFKRTETIQFCYNDKPISVMIQDVFVYPQAYAAIAPQKAQLNHHLRVFLIDIGGYTTDVLLLRSGKPDMQFCRSLEKGVIDMNNNIIRLIGVRHDMLIEEEHIQAVLSGKETILPQAVKETIRESADQYAKSILDKLRELQVDLRSNPAVFIGGGSALFRDYLEHSPLVAQATFVESPNANAIGYQAMAEGQLSLTASRGEI